jgi:hypothetical protein
MFLSKKVIGWDDTDGGDDLGAVDPISFTLSRAFNTSHVAILNEKLLDIYLDEDFTTVSVNALDHTLS